MTQYQLYRALARAIYALALDAAESRNLERAELVELIASSAFDPLREALGGHTPVYEIIEYLNPPKVVDDEWWDFSLENLKTLKEIYPEVLD